MWNFQINGIQQIGVGTVNFYKSKNWFASTFGFNTKILEDDTIAERMLPYTGGKPQKRHAGIMVNLQGGGGLEIWQYSKRIPVPPYFDPTIGDLGIFAAKIRCRDIKACHDELTARWTLVSPVFMTQVSPVCKTPDGLRCFYLKDLYGNLFQVIEDKQKSFIDQNKLTGGVAGAMIGVSDMDRSVEFYREVLGYETVIYDVQGIFEDWQNLSGHSFRRVLLSRSKKLTSAFSELLGENTLELVQVLDNVPRKIYEGRFWGDPGFIQICYDVCGMKELEKFCAEKGHPFTVDSCPNDEKFDMGDASGHFTYIEDPDGTLIEFVETGRIPIAKKFGLFIDMSRRDRRKPLPKILFRLLGLASTIR